LVVPGWKLSSKAAILVNLVNKEKIMKRSPLLSALLLGLALPLGAQTDPQTVDFLKQLDLKYYCPSREGLKGFTCDVTLALSDTFKKELLDKGADRRMVDTLDGHKVALSVDRDGKWNLQAAATAPTGDTDLDAQIGRKLEEFKKDLGMVVDTWVSDVYEPLFGVDDFTKTDTTMTKGADGFTLDQYSKVDGSTLKTDFDAGSKAVKATGFVGGAAKLTMAFDYSAQPQGYRLDGFTVNLLSDGIVDSDRVLYGKVGGYLLPLEIVRDVEGASASMKGYKVTYKFSHYKLNP
jgi:hypothetical protein